MTDQTSTLRRRNAAMEAVHDVPTRRKGKKPKRSLVSFHNLPSYLKDNEFIINHYRSEFSIVETVKSLFKVHNETGNIWTHLIGFLLFAALTVATAYLKPEPFMVGKDLLIRLEQRVVEYGRDRTHELLELENRLVTYGVSSFKDFETRVRDFLDFHNILKAYGVSNIRELEDRFIEYGKSNLNNFGQELQHLEQRVVEYGRSNLYLTESTFLKSVAEVLNMDWPVARWPVFVFTAGAMTCLLTSTMCHLFGCCSAHLSSVIWRLDYAGIAVLIVTSFVPPVYYGFLCYPRLQRFYLLTTGIMGLVTLCVSLHPVFQTRKFRPIRAGVYAGLGLWGIVPVIHGWILHLGIPEVNLALSYDILMGLVYLAGAAIYALRVPERWKPGAFDLAFHSHQIFHLAVVIAACVHYKSITVFLRWRDTHVGCPGI